MLLHFCSFSLTISHEVNYDYNNYRIRAILPPISITVTILMTSIDRINPIYTPSQHTAVCVVKPYRGVASDGVYLCHNLREAKESFFSLFQKPQFGGGMNEAVLIQVCFYFYSSSVNVSLSRFPKKLNFPR